MKWLFGLCLVCFLCVGCVDVPRVEFLDYDDIGFLSIEGEFGRKSENFSILINNLSVFGGDIRKKSSIVFSFPLVFGNHSLVIQDGLEVFFDGTVEVVRGNSTFVKVVVG